MPDVILFDGVCNFCNASINWIIDHDPDHRYRFAALQSEYGQDLLQKTNRSSVDFDSVILWRDDEAFEKSEAALEIVRHLRGWSWLYGFRFVPLFIRNFCYDLVARNRYRLFGRTETCRIPNKEERDLFL